MVGAWLLSSGIAEAGELNLRAATSVGYDSNIFNRPSDDRLGGIDGAEINLQFNAEVRDQIERGDYTLFYAPSYFTKTAEDTKAFWNHTAGFAGTYNLSPRTRLTVREHFLFVERLNLVPGARDAGAPPPPVEDPDIDAQNNLTIRNTVVLGATHFFSPRWSGSTGVNFVINRYTIDGDDSDNNSVSGNLGASYALTHSMQVGLGASGSYRTFSGTTPGDAVTFLPPAERPCFGETSPRSRTVSYSGFASVAYLFDQSTNLRVQAGPARIESEFYRCPGLFFDKEKIDQLTWFAEGEFTKRWSHVSTALGYRRQQGLASGGDTTISEIASGSISWKLARLWNLGVSASWIRQDSLSGVAATSWTASTSLQRQFLQRLSARVSVAYRTETGSRAYDTWGVSLGVSYQLDPVRF